MAQQPVEKPGERQRHSHGANPHDRQAQAEEFDDAEIRRQGTRRGADEIEQHVVDDQLEAKGQRQRDQDGLRGNPP